jgi:hypothetical protein
MVNAPFTAYSDTPNKSVRQDVARRGVVLHHAAMTSFSGLRRLAMGGKQVSATAIVKDGQAEVLVGDEYRPWSLSSAYWDSAMRSVETCNESTDGWTVSDASHWTLARLVAFWAEKDGFFPHRGGHPSTWTVIGHREVYSIHGASYATACPGSMDLDLVVARAQQILAGSDPDEELIEEEDMRSYARFITDNPAGAWWVTDGLTRRALASGEAQFLVDIGVATFEEGDRKVKIVPTEYLSRIPVAK